MDGLFYCDTLKPHNAVNVAAVTLSTTNKALYPVSNIPAMGKDYWWVGKKVQIRAFGQMTTGTTPGTLTVSLLYGTGADNTGVNLVSSPAQTLIASQTNQSFMFEFWVHCRSVGSTGTLFATGTEDFSTAVVANGGGLIPTSAPAVSASCDLTVASDILSIQALRSGSTAETMQIVDMEVIALN
jgi:hypothetical protein